MLVRNAPFAHLGALGAYVMVERGGGVKAVRQHAPILIQNWQLQHHLRRAGDLGAVATGRLLRPKARDSGTSGARI